MRSEINVGRTVVDEGDAMLEENLQHLQSRLLSRDCAAPICQHCIFQINALTHTHTLSNTRTHSICTNCMWYSLVGSILWSFCFCGSVFRSVFGYAVLGAKRLMLSEREELSHPVITWKIGPVFLMGRSLDQQIGLVYFPRSRGSNWKVCCLPILIDIQFTSFPGMYLIRPSNQVPSGSQHVRQP